MRISIICRLRKMCKIHKNVQNPTIKCNKCYDMGYFGVQICMGGFLVVPSPV